MLPTKITAAQNGDALGYHKVRGLYFPAAIFAATIVNDAPHKNISKYSETFEIIH